MKIIIELPNNFYLRDRPVIIPVGKYGYVEIELEKEKNNEEIYYTNTRNRWSQNNQ